MNNPAAFPIGIAIIKWVDDSPERELLDPRYTSDVIRKADIVLVQRDDGTFQCIKHKYDTKDVRIVDVSQSDRQVTDILDRAEEQRVERSAQSHVVPGVGTIGVVGTAMVGSSDTLPIPCAPYGEV